VFFNYFDILILKIILKNIILIYIFKNNFYLTFIINGELKDRDMGVGGDKTCGL